MGVTALINYIYTCLMECFFVAERKRIAIKSARHCSCASGGWRAYWGKGLALFIALFIHVFDHPIGETKLGDVNFLSSTPFQGL